ncbi:MAG TPA: trimeric intracellular cation channel family protein [Brumimicrobium sp.]|nr:trimeric intracellular cation channel family protein [Brumimicrobium sp.]HTO37266.1 trimeric intracellular cation channel family protein [Brumimicrobium sp.]
MFEVLDHIGLIAFAVSGILTAAKRKIDIVGGYVIAFITALGGGTIRDLLLYEEVAWTTSFSQVTVVIVAATLGIIFHKILMKWKRTLLIFDAVGISVFTIIGVQKGIAHEQMYVIAVSLGMITATFGGLLRDVLCNDIPIIFQQEMYAIPCLAGGALYLLGDYFGFGNTSWLIWGSVLFIIAFRILAINFSWRSPIIKNL